MINLDIMLYALSISACRIIKDKVEFEFKTDKYNRLSGLLSINELFNLLL